MSTHSAGKSFPDRENVPDYVQGASKIIEISQFSKEERIMIGCLEKAKEDAIPRELYAQRIGMEEGRKDAIREMLKLLRKVTL